MTREEKQKKWLKEHERLSEMFEKNRFAFEMERKKIIKRTIDVNPSHRRRKKLRNLQASWDAILKHSGSGVNRFVLIQMLFWNQIQNDWIPALNAYKKQLQSSCHPSNRF